MNELDQELIRYQELKERSWGKIISMLKRHFETWAMDNLACHGYEDFKMGYMPLLMNIHPEGTTNTELAKRARITKQAMSKVVKELISLGYVATESHGSDKRSSMIYLTTRGKKLVVSSRQKISELEEEYKALLGKKKFEELKETLGCIIKYHDGKAGLS